MEVHGMCASQRLIVSQRGRSAVRRCPEGLGEVPQCRKDSTWSCRTITNLSSYKVMCVGSMREKGVSYEGCEGMRSYRGCV